MMVRTITLMKRKGLGYTKKCLKKRVVQRSRRSYELRLGLRSGTGRKSIGGENGNKHSGEFGQTMQCDLSRTRVRFIAISASAAEMYELTCAPLSNPRNNAQ